MEVIVRRGPLHPPIVATNKATWVEIRDPEGRVMFVIFFPVPGGDQFITISRLDKDFFQQLKSFGINATDSSLVTI